MPEDRQDKCEVQRVSLGLCSFTARPQHGHQEPPNRHPSASWKKETTSPMHSIHQDIHRCILVVEVQGVAVHDLAAQAFEAVRPLEDPVTILVAGKGHVVVDAWHDHLHGEEHGLLHGIDELAVHRLAVRVLGVEDRSREVDAVVGQSSGPRRRPHTNTAARDLHRQQHGLLRGRGGPMGTTASLRKVSTTESLQRPSRTKSSRRALCTEVSRHDAMRHG